MTTTNYSIGPISTAPVQRSTFLSQTFTRDVYSFSTNDSNINLNLHNITFGDDADLSLYQDINSNGVLDSADLLLDSSVLAGNSDDSINYSVSGGNYLAVVD